MHKINPRNLMIAGYAISVCLIFQSLIAYVTEKKKLKYLGRNASVQDQVTDIAKLK